MSKLYTPQEVADILQLKKTTVYSYIRDGKLTAAKFGKEYRIDELDLKAFIDNAKK
ncbi:helix-turn-helix domain-containing protein [Priestia megaterium]|uniref:helix-turn-helix domain-containing protein n=1 Tax=Priestia megaterium TaxID=1404 RepID=UPI002FFD6A49